MAEFKLGRIRFVWKDEWTTDTTYYQDDVISFSGKTYICVTGHTSQADFFTDFDIVPSKWNLMAEGQEWKGEWAVNTYYVYGNIVSYGARLYICNTIHTSAATILDETDGLELDLSKWTVFAEGLDWKGTWSTSTRYRINDLVKYGGTTYVCNTLHVSAADAADGLEFDQSKWDYLNQGLEYKSTWTAGTRYKQNDLVRYGAGVWICTTQHTGSATFAADVANWEKFVEGFQYENDWSPYILYQNGDIVRYGGNQYIATDTSNGNVPTLTPAEWDLFTEGFRLIGDWNEDSANQEYKIGEVVRLGGFTYIATQDNSGQQPPNADYWKRLNEGFRWRGEWFDDQEYFEGDVVRYNTSSYICTKYHISEGDDYSTETLVGAGGGADGSRPDLADSGQYWSVIAIGSEESVLTTTGDLVYYTGEVPTRLPIGKEGQVLTVSPDSIPGWEFLQSVEDVYFVAEHGVDRPFPESGSNIDRPFKTIRYACEQIEKGTKFSTAQYMLELNRVFIQEEVASYINNQIANAAPGSIWENFGYAEDKCKRDIGIIIDKIKWDLGHGGNLKVRSATQSLLGLLGDGPFSVASEQDGSGYYPGLANESDVSVDAYNYMLTIIGNILSNEAPTTIYQNVTDDSTAITTQYINTSLIIESEALPRITELTGIITTALASQSANDIPAREISHTLIKVSTGKHYEVLPIVVPAYCAVLGDELRATQIYAGPATTPATDTPNTVATFDRIADVVSKIVAGTTVSATTGNNEVQSQNWPTAITEQSEKVSSLVDLMKYQIDYGLKTMSAGYYTDPVGYNVNLGYTRASLIANRDFLKAEVIAFLDTEYPALKYGRTDSRRDTGFIIDSLIYDLTYGGNSMAIIAGLSYWDGDDETYDQLPASLKTECIASINYLKTTAQTVADNVEIVSPKQTTVSQVLTGNAGSLPEIATNVESIIDIINNGPDAVGVTTTLVNPTLTDGVNSTTALITAKGALDTATAGIKTNTTSWINTNYPDLVYNSAKCERDVGKILEAVGFDFALNSNYRTLKAAHAYLRKTAVEVYTGGQKQQTREAIQYALLDATNGAIANVASDATAIARITASARIIDAVLFGATDEGSVCQTDDQNAYYAMLQLERNREFIVAEVSAWITYEIANAASGSIWENYTYNSELCLRDVGLYIDAIKMDLMYPGNYSSRMVARYYNNSVTGSQEEDMFYLRDATGVRNCSLFGLNGDLLPANSFGTSRPSAGAYCSLDPGFGPDDFKTWIISRSPYIQGVTTFGYGAIGQKIDGALHNGGNDSMVSNDFTQVISDGIGAWITNNGRAELVSVFTYYSHIGYLAEEGGRIRATNGNNSYGDFGSVAEGVDAEEIPTTAIVDNLTQYKATSSNTYTDNNQLLQVEYNHAGNNYTEANFNIFGAGSGAELIGDEFRDNGMNYVLVDQNADPDIAIGGEGYVVASNVAQTGTTNSIFLSATDGNLSSAYPGMKVYIIGGAGIGQFGIIDTYNAGSKEAAVIRESDGVSGWDHIIPGTTIIAPNASSTYQVEPAVSITAPTKTSTGSTLSTTSTWVDAEYIETSALYTGVTATGGAGSGATFDVTRNGSKYYLTINAAGTDYTRLETLTILGTDLGGASPTNDILVTATSVNSVTGAIVDFDFDGTGQKGKFLAIGSGTTGSVSIDGTTWTTETLPSLGAGNWSNIASGLIDDGSSTFKEGYAVVIADGAGDVAYSSDIDTWVTAALPGALNVSGENTVAFGQVDEAIGRFTVISDADTDVAYSDNGGQTWTLQSAALPATGFDEMTFGAGRYVAINSGTTSAVYSNNGITWIGVTAPGTFAAATDIVWGNGKFVALGGTNNIMYSFDGTEWFEGGLALPITATEKRLAYGQGIFILTSTDTGNVMWSEDGIYWQSYTLSSTHVGGHDVAVFGNPNRDGRFVVIGAGNSNVLNVTQIGATAKGRVSVANEQIFEIRITEPGSGYTTAPAITIVDPNNTADVDLVSQLGKGVLGQPTFKNRGTGYISSSIELDNLDSNGSAEFPQTGSFIAVRRLTRRPVNGSNIEFASLPGEFYKLVNVISFLGTNDGSFTGFLQLSPGIEVSDALPNNDAVEMRIRFSQVRLTGHDFLDIGTGNLTKTNYPGLPTVQPNQVKETTDSNGGRVFFTSTDQDGNFRVGDLFSIEQSTGVATLNAEAFNIAGLQELQLGEVTLGGNSASITEFSTDPFFTANSDNIVPTQRAIKAYIESQIGGGGATLNVNSVTAGDIFIGTDTITTVSGDPINIKANVVFSGSVLGLPLAYNLFLR